MKELCKEFVNHIAADNKPAALKTFNALIEKKIRQRIDQKKEALLSSRKI